jgi:hypothetical protein
MKELEGYWLVPEAHIAAYESGPVGEVDAETYGRWLAVSAQWKGLQAELAAYYSTWSNE